jgi:hypothetical protein
MKMQEAVHVERKDNKEEKSLGFCSFVRKTIMRKEFVAWVIDGRKYKNGSQRTKVKAYELD